MSLARSAERPEGYHRERFLLAIASTANGRIAVAHGQRWDGMKMVVPHFCTVCPIFVFPPRQSFPSLFEELG